MVVKDAVKGMDYYSNLPYTVILERYDDQGTYWVAAPGSTELIESLIVLPVKFN